MDGIKYQRLGDEHYYAQELFEQEELTGYLKNLIDAKKSVYEQVIYDSDSECAFADQLEKNTAIKVYAKLPGWFTVPTPLGGNNPDWAVLVEQEGEERLYFVVETKGTKLFSDALRPTERAKIDCAQEHFKALEVQEAPARYCRGKLRGGCSEASAMCFPNQLRGTDVCPRSRRSGADAGRPRPRLGC